MSRVYIVQQPSYFDHDKKRFVDKYDLSPARKHGELVFLLGPGNIFRDRLTSATDTLKERLADFSVDDFVLAVGDPVAIAAAVLIAGKRTGGHVNLLKWDRISASYESFPVSTAT